MWAGHQGLWAAGTCPHVTALAPCRLQQCRCPTVSVASGRKPGRPKKDQTDEEIAARAAAGRRKSSATPKKRGPKPTTSGDTLQLLDPDVLEELRATAAAEEAVRMAQPAEPEADPARFNFHRILMNAASRGLPEEAEKVVSQMQGAGLPPGPRAYHALAFAYVRSKQPYEALDVARRAAELDLQLLPETFVVLIFSLLNHPDDPDVTSAQQVLESMEAQGEYMGADASGVPVAQAGWLMLCKELFRKGLIAEAMTSVKRGYDAKGYVSDPELAAFVIVQLAKAGLKDRAYQEVQALEALGYRPGPEHYNPLIKAEAALGAWRRARYLMLDAFQKPNWMPPNTDSFTALLEGMVLSVDPVSGMPTGPGVESDVSGRLKDVERPSAVDDMDEQDMQAATSGTQALGEQFKRLREEMLRFGLRPNAAAYAAMCSGYIKMRATDEALGSFQAMCDAGVAGGTTRLLPKKRLTALLVMLTEDDRPADMLNILKALVSFNQPLPKSAMAPLDHVTPGATLTAAWLPAHFEYMRTHPDDGTGREVGGTAMASMRNILTEAAEAEDFDGVLISKMGGGVVADDGSGVWLKTSKMTLDELRAELEHAGIEYPEGAKKKALSALVKARRESLPRSVTEIQSHLEASRKAEAEALERKTGIKIEDGSKSSKKGKMEIKEFRVFQMEDGKLSKIQNIVQEVAKKKVGFTVERGGKDPYGADDALSEGAGEVEDDDELADILKEGVDEGIADIVRDPDSVFGDASEGMPGSDGVLMDDGSGLEITIDHIEARVLNRTAGMRVALEVLRCVEMLGGSPSGPDYEALVAGVLAEANAVAALELSERLPRLLSLGYSRESVLSLFEQLARVCLNALKGGSTDLVLERAEDLGLEPDAGLYAMLSKALGDRPRHRQLAAAEMQDLVEDSVNPDLLIQDDEGTEAEGATRMPLVADDDVDEEDEEEGGVYGRIPTAQPVGGEEVEPGPASLTGDPSWKAKGQAGAEEAPPVPIAIQLLSRLSDDVMPEGLLDDLQYISQASMAPTPTLLPDGVVDGEVEQAGRELKDGSMDLGDGLVVTREQLDLIDAEVARGAREWEALAAAGLITEEEAEQMKELMQGEADEEAEEQPESDDEDYQEAERDFKELLGGAMFERVAAAQQRVAELDEQAEEAREQGDEEGAAGLLEQSIALQAELQAELQPRMAEFLQRGMSEERIAKWDAAVDRQLADDESYRLAAREIFTEQLEAAGYTVTQQVLDQWDASPTLLQIGNDPEEPLAQLYEELSQMEDNQAMMEALGELEVQAANSMALDGPPEQRLLTAPSSDKP